MIRVLHVVTYMGRGGLETMIMNYYRHIDRNRVQFDFLVHREFEADYDREICALGGRIFRMPRLNPFSPEYYHAINAFFRENRYRIVHCHLDCMSAYCLLFAQKYGAEIRIAHAHNKNQEKNAKLPIKLISKWFIPRYVTHLFACSREAGNWMFPGKSFFVIKNAIDVDSFAYRHDRAREAKKKFGIENGFVVGHVGRFHLQKNHGFLLDVFKEVNKREPDSVLVLVGTGDLQDSIKRKTDELGLREKVLFLGNCDDVASVLLAMDVFVFPSYYEGLGIAAIEAQAAGLPCILSDQVPLECKVSVDTEFVSLKEGAGMWAERVCRYRNYLRMDQAHRVIAAGYDISYNAKKLEAFYLQEEAKNEA